ncbi:MAG TPA: glycosyltransferase family 4 protein [Pyrinomonadaceae bacterium]|jgi:glycosyltransferase involved in cell wall biosynthesis
MTLKGRRVLFISYNGMLDPLGQSQVIPYLRELSEREGVRFTLLSFEREAAFGDEGEARSQELKIELSARGIEWHRMRYHRRPSLPATVYDVLAGTRYAKRLVRRNRIELVHARSHIPATMALALKRDLGTRMIFDVRGLLAEEYRDAGHWRAGSFKYRLTKRMERRAFAAADGVVTLTERIWEIIRDWDGLRGRAVAHQVIPCCADLERFRFDAVARRERRAELNLSKRFVLVYSGSIGGWYLEGEMSDFFKALKRERPDAHFLWLTPGSHERVEALMRERGLERESYTVRAAPSSEVASYLSASDAGIAFIKPCFSKLASSPTKTAEYLACGLPVVLNVGVGDSDLLVTRERVGALVAEFTTAEYARASALVRSMSEEREATQRHAREVVERLFDVRRVGLEGYARLYEEVLG